MTVFSAALLLFLAIERLMGMLLVAIAIQMLMAGVAQFIAAQ